MLNTETRYPTYLDRYVVKQQYHHYNAIDQAVWRYVMQQNLHFLNEHAYSEYYDNFKELGIKEDEIPAIELISEKLSKIGWSAVGINDLIPLTAFMEFHYHKCLPIVVGIRPLKDIKFSKEPDILHESAGHAPLVVNREFADYLNKMGMIGTKVFPDEAVMLNRLSWWTVEYGLIGNTNKPKIFGAALLSSVEESKASMGNNTFKHPFKLDSVLNTPFNITDTQKQLYVFEEYSHLNKAIDDFINMTAFARGGTYGLNMAAKSQKQSTIELESDLQISGVIDLIKYDDKREAKFVLVNQKPKLYKNSERVISNFNDFTFESCGIFINELDDENEDFKFINEELKSEKKTKIDLQLRSGITLKGEVEYLYDNDQIIYLAFNNCRIIKNGEIFFSDESNITMIAFVNEITSVYCGLPNLTDTYFEEGTKYKVKSHEENEYPEDLIKLYSRVRHLRTNEHDEQKLLEELLNINSILQNDFPNDWLLRAEILELLITFGASPNTYTKLKEQILETNAEFEMDYLNRLVQTRKQLSQ